MSRTWIQILILDDDYLRLASLYWITTWLNFHLICHLQWHNLINISHVLICTVLYYIVTWFDPFTLFMHMIWPCLRLTQHAVRFIEESVAHSHLTTKAFNSCDAYKMVSLQMIVKMGEKRTKNFDLKTKPNRKARIAIS